MRIKFGGVGGSVEATRSTNADSDAIQSDSHVDTSCIRVAIGRPSNAIGSLVCAGKHEDFRWKPPQSGERPKQRPGTLPDGFCVGVQIRTPYSIGEERVSREHGDRVQEIRRAFVRVTGCVLGFQRCAPHLDALAVGDCGKGKLGALLRRQQESGTRVSGQISGAGQVVRVDVRFEHVPNGPSTAVGQVEVHVERDRRVNDDRLGTGADDVRQASLAGPSHLDDADGGVRQRYVSDIPRQTASPAAVRGRER
jgi:hypothetical protein